MQIITSGSFINIENQEKIEQLVFTAKEIADAAVETNGFTSIEEQNEKLALEIWQGAEYMTREHERAQIQNIFVSNFLERLREIAPAPNDLPKIPVASSNEIPVNRADADKDEFLGFVTAAAAAAETNNENGEVAGFADNVAEKPQAINLTEVVVQNREPMPITQTENPETKTTQPFETATAEMDNAAPDNVEPDNVEPDNSEPEVIRSIAPKRKAENKIAEVSQIPRNHKPAVGTTEITLYEKEPYRWDDCTVTATIQLLPVESGGVRRAVLGIRTHDFAPQISVIELADAAKPEDILPALEKAFEKYKADLPVKVMDKMKREKTGDKKRPTNNTPQTKHDSSGAEDTAVSKPETESANPCDSESENNQSATAAAATAAASISKATFDAPQIMNANRDKTSVKTNKSVDNNQGNLFGF